MDFTVSTIESAAHTAVEAIEHPFHTIGARLKSAGEHLASFFGHPYCAPPLREALDALHGVVVDLAQEVAELRVPCPCKPAPTSATVAAGAGMLVVEDLAAKTMPAAAPLVIDGEPVSPEVFAQFTEWLKARQIASLTGQTGA